MTIAVDLGRKATKQTPGESHNEWYHYYCSNLYVFKKTYMHVLLVPAVPLREKYVCVASFNVNFQKTSMLLVQTVPFRRQTCIFC